MQWLTARKDGIFFNFKLNIMFYIGQKIVAIRDHSAGLFKKGQEFTVLNLKESTCMCKDDLIDIGIKSPCGISYCRICEKETYSDIWWIKSRCFAPLETYGESYSIAIELVQELQQVDKQKIYNPKKVEI